MVRGSSNRINFFKQQLRTLFRLHNHQASVASIFEEQSFLRQKRRSYSGTGYNADDEENSASWKWLQQFINYERQGLPNRQELDFKFKLDRVRNLLEKLRNPQNEFRAIHVAGTKGKGSTVSFLSHILQCGGYRVGTYVSPHILSFRERIQFNNQSISLEEFEQLVQMYGPTIEGVKREESDEVGGMNDLSFFEVMTALAFRYFADKQIDYAVVETGLGGELDATNVLSAENVSATVLTKIDYDHMHVLGNDIESIAKAKAGIIKTQTPVIIGAQKYEQAGSVFRQFAEYKNSGQIVIAEDVVQVEGKGYQVGKNDVREMIEIRCKPSLQHDVITLEDIGTQLIGSHQHENIATSIATINQMFPSAWSNKSDDQQPAQMSMNAIKQGLQNASIYGRFQVVPLRGREEDNRRAVLDGAHTEGSAAAMAKTLREVFPENPVVLIVAMAADKDHQKVMQTVRSQLQPVCVIFTTVAIGGAGSNRSCPPGTLVASWQLAGMKIRGGRRCRELIQGNMKAAIDKAQNELDGVKAHDGIICVTGSMYAVAEALKILQQT